MLTRSPTLGGGSTIDGLLSLHPEQSVGLSVAAVEHHGSTEGTFIDVEVTADVTVVRTCDGDLGSVTEPHTTEERVGHVARRNTDLADSWLALIGSGALVVASD